MPHLSYHTELLRAMLKQDALFHLDKMTNSSFQCIKELTVKTVAQPLRYNDQSKPHSSQRGLSACLAQKEQSIAFPSKSLIDNEARYANIESDLLAIVFACQHFNTYILGRPFTVSPDLCPSCQAFTPCFYAFVPFMSCFCALHALLLHPSPPAFTPFVPDEPLSETFTTCYLQHTGLICPHHL